MCEAAVVESGPADEVLTTPTGGYARRLLAAEPAHWGHAWMRSQAPAEGEVLVRGEGLAMAYAGRPVFEGLDLEIGAGERVAVTGTSGAGTRWRS